MQSLKLIIYSSTVFKAGKLLGMVLLIIGTYKQEKKNVPHPCPNQVALLVVH